MTYASGVTHENQITNTMGPIGMPELVVIFIALILLVIPAGIAIAVVLYFSSRKKPPLLPQVPRGIQERLTELDALRSNKLISDAEHEEKRRQILRDI